LNSPCSMLKSQLSMTTLSIFDQPAGSSSRRASEMKVEPGLSQGSRLTTSLEVVPPTAISAPRVVEQMKSVFQGLQGEGIAILFIEQNVRLALSIAGRGYILESGRLAIEGDAPTLINSPEVRRIFLGG